DISPYYRTCPEAPPPTSRPGIGPGPPDFGPLGSGIGPPGLGHLTCARETVLSTCPTRRWTEVKVGARHEPAGPWKFISPKEQFGIIDPVKCSRSRRDRCGGVARIWRAYAARQRARRVVPISAMTYRRWR